MRSGRARKVHGTRASPDPVSGRHALAGKGFGIMTKVACTRRSFIKTAGAAGIALTVSVPVTGAALADDAPVADVAATTIGPAR